MVLGRNTGERPHDVLVQKAFEAFARRDLFALVELLDPDVEFFAPTAMIANEGRCYRGHEGIERYLHDVELQWARLDLFPESFREVGNHVVVIGHVLAKARDGLEVESPAAWVWQIRSGKLVWGCAYANPDESFMGLTVSDEPPQRRFATDTPMRAPGPGASAPTN